MGFTCERELNNPIGWKWVEEFTDLNPPPRQMAGNNPPANPVPVAGQDDKAKMLKQPPPKRPIPKL